MIAVVTGGTGFIGQNLVRRLLADGNDVRCLVRASGSERQLPAGATRFVVDFESVKSLCSCDALQEPDVVFHLAGATRALREADFVKANVTPTRQLLSALATIGRPTRFVYVSSQAAAGPASSFDTPVREDDPPRPVEAYGRSKLDAERIVESFSERLPTVVIRPCAVLGPYDRDFLRLFQLAGRGVIVYPSTARHWMSLLHVRDVVSGLIAAATQEGALLRTYFLSSAAPTQWRELGDLIARTMNVRPRHIDLPRPVVDLVSRAGQAVGHLAGRPPLANRHKAALSHHAFWVCSPARAERELGFRQTCSLPDAVRDTYLWYVEHGWLHGSPGRSAPVV